MLSRIAVLFLAFLIVPSAAFAAEKPLEIVASFSILGDMAKNVGGEDANVSVLVGPNEDAHTYQATPEDIKKLAKADIILINGLHFEGWLARAIDASKTKAKLLVASAGIKPRFLQDGEHHHESHEQAHEGKDGEPAIDPHAWLNLAYGRLYVRNIVGGMIEARPEREAILQNRAQIYIRQLVAIEQELKAAIAKISRNNRKVITSHDSFGYFGDAYGLTFLSPVGLSTEAEPSAEELALLIDQIKKEGVKALFLENLGSPRLIEQIEKDTGAKIGGTLYSDALSAPDGEAPTYLELFRHNARVLVAALGLDPASSSKTPSESPSEQEKKKKFFFF